MTVGSDDGGVKTGRATGRIVVTVAFVVAAIALVAGSAALLLGMALWDDANLADATADGRMAGALVVAASLLVGSCVLGVSRIAAAFVRRSD